MLVRCLDGKVHELTKEQMAKIWQHFYVQGYYLRAWWFDMAADPLQGGGLMDGIKKGGWIAYSEGHVAKDSAHQMLECLAICGISHIHSADNILWQAKGIQSV